MVLIKLCKKSSLTAAFLQIIVVSLAQAANMTNESHMTLNSVDYGKVVVGSEVPTTSSGQLEPIDNPDTILDESSFDINL